MSKLVITEKPSVAQSIAKVLSATKRCNGYLEGNGYLISWCIGHLVELAPPDHYDERYGKWKKEAFLERRTDSYAILQLRDIDETRQEQFASLDYLHRHGKEPDIDHYEIVYTADLPTFTDRDVMLESLYTKFNIDHPADFTGHSLSVSDIVALKTGGVVSFHYVDFVGFTELKDFLRAGNHLKNAEMALEDDYGMIDGIINNGKAGADRERPSVLEKLKAASDTERGQPFHFGRTEERELE